MDELPRKLVYKHRNDDSDRINEIADMLSDTLDMMEKQQEYIAALNSLVSVLEERIGIYEQFCELNGISIDDIAPSTSNQSVQSDNTLAPEKSGLQIVFDPRKKALGVVVNLKSKKNR